MVKGSASELACGKHKTVFKNGKHFTVFNKLLLLKGYLSSFHKKNIGDFALLFGKTFRYCIGKFKKIAHLYTCIASSVA